MIMDIIIAICMKCHKYRNYKNEWQSNPPYIHRDDKMKLSHTYCPTCIPEIRKEMFGEVDSLSH